MFQIKVEVPSRNEIEKALVANLKNHITKKVGAIRCPDHGQEAEIVVKGNDFSNITFDISGCCSKLIDEVKRKIK
jgi:hypothetical protein